MSGSCLAVWTGWTLTSLRNQRGRRRRDPAFRLWVALSLKELALVSPMMAEELILVIRESAGLKADRNHVSFDVRLGEVEQAVEVMPGIHLDTVLCLLGYVQMGIGDFPVWAMIDSGLMVNLLPTDLV
ncbi:hypothetical protein VP01_555g4 [Puccinia sorghi]|uniref:Uncharacterized protein n=1 Tax=Puccinia sorghi TaxID=27349 RepID=A0A0L6UJ55_9BASI|nr:hypothetical protein VP01_555g4 [Puccinia sorghi]